jgi:hypothetical protein
VATVQVGRLDRTVNEVAGKRGCDWHTVNDAVVAYGEASLDAGVERVGQLDAVGWRKPFSSGMARGIFSSGARR